MRFARATVTPWAEGVRLVTSGPALVAEFPKADARGEEAVAPAVAARVGVDPAADSPGSLALPIPQRLLRELGVEVRLRSQNGGPAAATGPAPPTSGFPGMFRPAVPAPNPAGTISP